MVMHYMSKGNLREYLSKNYQQLNFENKLQQLNQITQGLCSIHEANLIHQDFHSGNVLNDLQNNYVFSLISDLGLSRPVSEAKQGKLYGVLPYVAPEILKGEPYTQSSDIYSFGIMTYELLTNTYPYADLNLDDTSLALKICQGLRPNLEQVRTPQLLKDLIIRC